MTETPPTPPTNDDELSPQEEAKFSKFLARVLSEEDANHPKPPTPPTAPAPAPPAAPTAPAQQSDLRTQIRGILDERDKEKDRDSTIDALKREVESLKNAPKPKQRPWWSPLM